jgi:DNA-binding transcriptional LysR family regulator
MINLDRLRVLHAIATHGSVNGAAVALHVSASAISQQVAKLEREIGQDILIRSGRGIRLTEAALLLANRASPLLAAMEELEGDLDDLGSNVSGTITIAAFPTAARGIGPRLVQRVQRAHPDLRLSLREEEPTESIPALVRGDVDVVIAQDWFNAPIALPPGLVKHTLFDDVVDIALPLAHPLAKRRQVTLEQLAVQPWVTWPAGTICGDWLLHTYRSIGREPVIAHTAGEHATQLAFVDAGLGAAVIPRLGRGAVPSGVRMVRSSPSLLRHVFATWRVNNARRTSVAAVQSALDTLRL